MKRAVLLYGIGGGLLIAVLKLTEYRFLVVEHSIELYGGLIALIFAIVGIRVGQGLKVIYFKLAPDFGDKYVAYAINKVKPSGASQAKIDETTKQMQTFKAMYDRALLNAAMTLMEPLPVGVVVTLISAAVLRRKNSQSVQV